MPDLQMLCQQPGIADIVLRPVRHQYSDDTAGAQRLRAERRNNRTVFSSGNTDHRIAVRSVLQKELPYPLYAGILDCYCVKHHPVPSFQIPLSP